MNKINPGEIYFECFGYEANFVRFYIVLKRTAKTIFLKELARSETGSWTSGFSVPAKDENGNYIPLENKPIIKVRLTSDEKGNEYIRFLKWNSNPIEIYNHH